MKLIFSLLLCLFSLPGFGQEDDDALLEKLEADRRKQTEMAVKLNQVSEKVTSSFLSAPEHLKKLGYETVTPGALLDKKVVKLVQEMMANSTLKNASHEEVRNLVLEKAKGKPIESFLNESPRVVNVIVDILRDPKALSSLVGLLLRREDLKMYFFIWLSVMIAAWAIKKYTFSKNWSGVKRFVMGLMVSLLATTITMTTFYNIFHAELSPTAEIVLKHWRKRNLNI
jgi:hypothetical protein